MDPKIKEVMEEWLTKHNYIAKCTCVQCYRFISEDVEIKPQGLPDGLAIQYGPAPSANFIVIIQPEKVIVAEFDKDSNYPYGSWSIKKELTYSSFEDLHEILEKDQIEEYKAFVKRGEDPLNGAIEEYLQRKLKKNIIEELKQTDFTDYKLMLLRLEPAQYEGVKIGGYLKSYYLPTTIPDIIEDVGKNYGGGQYSLRIIDGMGKYVKSKTFEIAGEPKIPDPMTRPWRSCHHGGRVQDQQEQEVEAEEQEVEVEEQDVEVEEKNVEVRNEDKDLENSMWEDVPDEIKALAEKAGIGFEDLSNLMLSLRKMRIKGQQKEYKKTVRLVEIEMRKEIELAKVKSERDINVAKLQARIAEIHAKADMRNKGDIEISRVRWESTTKLFASVVKWASAAAGLSYIAYTVAGIFTG